MHEGMVCNTAPTVTGQTDIKSSITLLHTCRKVYSNGIMSCCTKKRVEREEREGKRVEKEWKEWKEREREGKGDHRWCLLTGVEKQRAHSSLKMRQSLGTLWTRRICSHMVFDEQKERKKEYVMDMNVESQGSSYGWIMWSNHYYFNDPVKFDIIMMVYNNDGCGFIFHCDTHTQKHPQNKKEGARDVNSYL
jgi:hypothetical protein